MSRFNPVSPLALVVTAASMSLLPAQPQNSDRTVFQTDRTAVTYHCESDMTLNITFMAIDNLPLIKLTHPSKRSGKSWRNLLLPQSQSGSGVCYATNFTSVHMKNDALVLTSRESTTTDEISPVRCAKTAIGV